MFSGLPISRVLNEWIGGGLRGGDWGLENRENWRKTDGRTSCSFGFLFWFGFALVGHIKSLLLLLLLLPLFAFALLPCHALPCLAALAFVACGSARAFLNFPAAFFNRLSDRAPASLSLRCPHTSKLDLAKLSNGH